MDLFQNTKEAIVGVNKETIALINQSRQFDGHSQSASDQWLQTCAHIEEQLNDHVLRIAIVGAIKSGKSTMVNALLGDDYLKRGAGVVTSIVTRVRRGDELGAHLFFKSWDEVNADIESALVLFPSQEWHNREQPFDIRRLADRNALQEALAALDAELHVARDRLNPNSVILASYLKGFDQVESLVGPENTTESYHGKRFADHRAFASDDALAAYLKDIELEITGDALATSIEVADCQGSDSPNPLHMAMIQDYLLKAHLIVYVISSRTGLRQADIRFLNIIKQMGIDHNILFVCNCDINEHEHIGDLEALTQRMKEELAMVMAEPQLYIFSALYHLFNSRQSKLSSKDKLRLDQWRSSAQQVALSDNEFARLKETLNHKLTRERSALLLQNQLERLDVIVHGFEHWIKVRQDLMQRDASEAQQMAQGIENHQGHMEQVLSMVHTALVGSLQSLKKEMRNAIDGYFDRHSGDVTEKAIAFVRGYRIDFESFKEQLSASGFNHTLYLIFQDFKQAVDGFMTETINPEIIGFINKKESRLSDYLISVAEPYGAMVRDAVQQYEGAMDQYDFKKISGQLVFDNAPDLNTIKQSKGLVLPPAAANMHYSAHIKTEAIVRLGMFSLARLFRKVLKKEGAYKEDESLRALKGGIRRMKRETERSLEAHFKDYRENIKFQYLLPLVEAAGNRLFESLTERFNGYVANLSTLVQSMGDAHSDKATVEAHLAEIASVITQKLRPQINRLREDVDQMRGDTQVVSKQQAAEN